MKHSKIILASRSKARRAMLDQAGLVYEAMAADLDEDALMQDFAKKEAAPVTIALELAKAKAASISGGQGGALVIGSDQVLECDGALLSKAKDKNEAAEKLKNLRGKTHSLISAVAVYKDGVELWAQSEKADLTMHDFSDDFLHDYVAKAGDALVNCVGAYEFEGLGAWLFSSVKGDYYTILGMPLLPLLQYLRTQHGIDL